ncbi:DUF6083 domain-containing protein [Kitasatospora purpeofusca]|uniref:DUF6083 domain-containing protein n=1 Tax=Kitasatospora purpeofusca TaxID=67352 RepID=UPI002E0FA1A4|nr:DUF6083 domain-containing protein [Kitasatospora purpeofusca]
MAPNSCSPGYNWDGSRKGPKATRALRIDPDSPTRLVRSARMAVCHFCGNAIEWCHRPDGTPIPLHPSELPIRHVPVLHRWHLAGGMAYTGAAGTPWSASPTGPCDPATADTPTQPPAPELQQLRRALTLKTRHLINHADFQPRTRPTPTAPSAAAETPTEAMRLPVVQMLHIRYLAPRPLPVIRCVAQTLRRTRCRNPVADPHLPGRWTLVPTDQPPAGGHRHLADHLVPAEMAVYDLTHLPVTEQLRWRGQRCPSHAYSRAADIALTQWEPFDAFAHRRHIRTHLPAPAGQDDAS